MAQLFITLDHPTYLNAIGPSNHDNLHTISHPNNA